MRLRGFVVLWLVVAVALFVLIPDSRVVAHFFWYSYIAAPEYIESEGSVAVVGYALVVGPFAYVPYLWMAAGLVGLVVYLIRKRRAGRESHEN